MMIPHLLSSAHWPAIREARYQIALLPWGATEAHNTHLPYATDTIHASAIAAESARRANERGARVIVLPAVPFGVQTGQLDIPLCLNLNPTTQLAVLRDIADSVQRAGIEKLVIVNGHGGNDFKPLIRELQPSTEVFLCSVDWWKAVKGSDYFTEPGDHAGELETSVLQHLEPGLVRPLSEAGAGDAREWKFAAMREGWAWAPRRWTAVTDDTGVGDPRRSTAENGAAFFEAAAEKIAGFLVELGASGETELYT